MLHLGFTAGLRVSELVGLCLTDLSLQPTPSIHVRGKGRRERALPLCKETTRLLRAWLAVRGEAAVPELFLNARGTEMSRSGFEYVLRKHVKPQRSVVPPWRRKESRPMSSGTAAQ